MSAGYSIKKDNLVVIWLDSEDTPGNLEQPHWPDGTPWDSKKEAESWAKAWLAHREDETLPMPGNGPDQPTIPTPTAEEAEAARAEKIAAIEAENAKALADAEESKIDLDAIKAEEALTAAPASE